MRPYQSPVARPKIKRYPCPRPCPPITDLHFLQLILALEFFEFSGIEFLDKLASGIVGIGMDDSVRRFVFHPGNDAGIAFRSRA